MASLNGMRLGLARGTVLLHNSIRRKRGNFLLCLFSAVNGVMCLRSHTPCRHPRVPLCGPLPHVEAEGACVVP